MKNNIHNILKNNISPEYIYVLKQFQLLNIVDKNFMGSILFDLTFLWDDPYSSKNNDNDNDNDNDNFYDDNIKIKNILDSWLVKIWKLNDIPWYWEKYKNNYIRAKKLKLFDINSDNILKYLSKDKSCFDFKYIYAPAFYPWQITWQKKYSLINKLFRFYNNLKNNYYKIISKDKKQYELIHWFESRISSQWYGVFDTCISFLEKDSDFTNPSKDKTFNKLLTLHKKWIIKFWIIPIIPVKTTEDIINRWNMPIAIDLFELSEKILFDLYRLIKEENSIDLYRIIFIKKDEQWPKYWLPSKSRIYYSNNKILDTNLK